jgi:hypothetical protein
MINRKKEKEEPVFSIDDRDFNIKVWYLEDTIDSKGDALVEIRYSNNLIREGLFPSYKIYNLAAHFSDIVDGELSKDDKDRGYEIAASTGFGGSVGIIPIVEVTD